MIPKNELPKYKITLPASKKTVEYRGFTVGEEKILLLAVEYNDIPKLVDALAQIISLCTFGVCDLNNMIQVDAEFLFINIRNKSMGEGVDVSHKCSACGNKIEMTLNLENIKVIETEKVDNNVRISENTIITLSFPSLDKTMNLVDSNDDMVTSIAKCIDMITIGETTYVKEDTPLEDFVEYLGSLNQMQIDTLERFFESMPRIIFDLDYTCVKCAAPNKIYLEGMNDFFV